MKINDIIPKILMKWIYNKVNPGIKFDGWGMKTILDPPWNEGNEYFLQTNQKVKEHFDFSGDDGINLTNVDKLLWRHWIVSYCVRHAIEFVGKDVDMVECGVCDGLTAFYALRELEHAICCSRMHLYDAWAPMSKEYLLEPELQSAGRYSNISIQRVKKNLSEFENVVYHPGYIPDSLHLEPSSPEKISYLHIDLNSTIPTIAALEYFFPRLLRGGVVLFDDYGQGYTHTKKAVDKFFADKSGILMPLPTGQAVMWKRI